MIDPEDLAVAVHEMFSQEARDEMGPLRIRKRRKVARKPKAKSTPASAIENAKPVSPPH